MGLKDNDIANLVDALMVQYDFLYANEDTFEIYKVVRDRTQNFWMEEFSFLGDMPAFRT